MEATCHEIDADVKTHAKGGSLTRHFRFEYLSESNIYHVTTRGAGRKILFEDDSDRQKYMHMLDAGLKNESALLLAWCLMDNHAHLLINMEIHALSALMHRLHTAYAQYFNGKYGHIGPVFQGRFDSRPVNSDEYLMLAVAYIHKNPKDVGEGNWRAYQWSSYQEYVDCPRYCETTFVLNVFGGREMLIEFHDTNDVIAEISTIGSKIRLNDSEVKAIIESHLGADYSDCLQLMDRTQRNRELVRLYRENLSARQIERLTGIGRNIVTNAVNKSSAINPASKTR